MLKSTLTAAAILTATSTAALACTPEDVLARQVPLVTAVQNLLAVNPTKAQEIVLKMQAAMDQAAKDGDEAATCVIMDEALAAATN